MKLVQGGGGLCYKFVSPGNRGVPDRLVITPDGCVFFVELKSQTGRLSELQKFQKSELEKRNVTVRVQRGGGSGICGGGVQNVTEGESPPIAGYICDDCETGKERGCLQARGIFYDPWGEGMSHPDYCPYFQSNGLDEDPLPF